MRISCLLALTLLLTLSRTPARAAEDDLAERVRRAIAGGETYLRSQQRQGNWEVGGVSLIHKGGTTSLVVLALLNAGVPPSDRAIRDGLAYLRTVTPKTTYVAGLQAMAFAQAGQNRDRERIRSIVKWLLKTRKADGWTYDEHHTQPGDGSNTQYALLGLHAAMTAGIPVDEAALRDLRTFYLKRQTPFGGWKYVQVAGVRAETLTMTTAGLSGLLITGMDLEVSKQLLDVRTGKAKNCGEYEDNEPVKKALAAITRDLPNNLTPDNAADALGVPFYALYGLERAGRLTGRRFFGRHDWYEDGCRCLIDAQDRKDGSWTVMGRRTLDSSPMVATSFALLFLSKGKTPVLVTKLAHGDPADAGWNRKHNDLRHLVDFASHALFHDQPLAWQNFDVRKRQNVKGLAASLLESPVVFVNGHELNMSQREKGILKEYLANGGFLLAEACCGSDTFDHDFRELMKELFPDNPLKPLPETHAVWNASGKWDLDPTELSRAFPLFGIQQGCKTIVIYSPRPLAGYWEDNLHKKDRGQTAFRLGANIIAYATGLEPPKPRLTAVEIVPELKHEVIKRGHLKVAQLHVQTRTPGDWQPAPQAMRNLMAEVRKTGLDVLLQTKEIVPASKELSYYRFLYLHGRYGFRVDAEGLKRLHFNLTTGGTLLADACCGSKSFDESFRKLMEQLWAKEKLKLEKIPLNDELFSKELNGKAITEVRCRRPKTQGPGIDPEYHTLPPDLEGIKYRGRWVVIYSRYDIGCALEKHPSTDCLGHDYASAVRLAQAAVLYALKR